MSYSFSLATIVTQATVMWFHLLLPDKRLDVIITIMKTVQFSVSYPRRYAKGGESKKAFCSLRSWNCTRGRPNVAEINYLLLTETEYSAKTAAWYSAETETETKCGRKQNTCTKSTTLSINCGYFFRPHSRVTIRNICYNVHLTQRTFQSESVVEIE